jgi:hypothetical protein
MDMAKDNGKEAVDPKLAAMYAKLDAKRAQAETDIEQVEFDIEKMTMDLITRWLNAHKTVQRGGVDYDALSEIFAEVIVDAPGTWGKCSAAATYKQLNPASWKMLDERFAAVVNYVTSKN